MPSLSCYVGVALCSGWSRSPAPDSPWCFSKNSLFCFLSSSCGPAATVTPLAGLGGGSRATLLLSLATAQRFPLGLLRSFPQRAGFVSLPLPVQAPWAGTEPESLSPHLHTHRWAPIPHLRGRGRGLSTSSPHPGHPRPQLPGWWLRLWAHLSAGSGGDPRAPQPHPHPALSPCPLAACASCLSASVFDSSTHVCPPAPCLRAPSAPCAPPWNVTSPWRRALGAPGLGLHRAGRAVGW